MPEQKYRAGSAGAKRGTNSVANGTRYRYIDDMPLVSLENAGLCTRIPQSFYKPVL